MLAGLGRGLLLVGGGVASGLGIVAAVYGPGDLVDSVRSKVAVERPAVTAPAKPEWGEGNVDRRRPLLPPDPGAAPASDRKGGGPSLDIVRVEPSGDAIIAGRGAPNAIVEILRDNKPYASGTADEAGQFAIVPPALPAGNSELTYRTTSPDGTSVMGKENVVVVVPDKRDTKPLVAVGTPNRPTEVLSQPGAPADTAMVDTNMPDTPPPAGTRADERVAAKTDAPNAAAKPLERVAALPESPSKPNAVEKKPDLKIVSVDAQEGGRLDVSGRAGAWSMLRLYLNDTLVATGKAGPDGRIAFTIGRGVSPGGYHIRLDQVDPGSGKVAHRAQVAFAFPDAAAAKAAAREEPAPPPKPQTSAKAVSVPPAIPKQPAAEMGSAAPEPAARVEATKPPSAPAASSSKPAETAAAAKAAAREEPAPPKPLASAKVEPVPPAIPKQLAAETGSAAPEPAARVEATKLPSAPAASSSKPAETVAAATRPTPLVAEAPSGLTTTWVQPRRQSPDEPAKRPVAGTLSVVGTAQSVPSRAASDSKVAEVPAPELPPAARPHHGVAHQSAAGPPAEAEPPKLDQGLTGAAPAPSAPGQTIAEGDQPGAVFVPEISTAKITRGDNLWVISKRTYGRGLHYTVIFDANQDQIRNPDLIYPGQIFVLPKDAPAGQGAKRG